VDALLRQRHRQNRRRLRRPRRLADTDEFVKIDGEWFFSLHRIHNEGNARTFTAGQENPVKRLDE
jgi:hypothetical protein